MAPEAMARVARLPCPVQTDEPRYCAHGAKVTLIIDFARAAHSVILKGLPARHTDRVWSQVFVTKCLTLVIALSARLVATLSLRITSEFVATITGVAVKVIGSLPVSPGTKESGLTGCTVGVVSIGAAVAIVWWVCRRAHI